MVLQNTDTVQGSVPKVNSIMLLLSLALIACQSILSCVPNTFESLKKLQNLIVVSADTIFSHYIILIVVPLSPHSEQSRTNFAPMPQMAILYVRMRTYVKRTC